MVKALFSFKCDGLSKGTRLSEKHVTQRGAGEITSIALFPSFLTFHSGIMKASNPS